MNSQSQWSNASRFSVTPLHPYFAARVTGIDLTNVSDDAFAELVSVFDEYSVLVFPDQHLTSDAHVAFSRRFGTLETMLKGSVGTGSPFAGITNVDPQTDTILAPADHRMKRQYSNELWHTDSSFKKLSAWASLLYAKEVPPTGGNTHFAALRRAWVDLDDSMKAIVRKLAAEHDFVYSRSILNDDQFLSAQQKAEVPAVPQALVVRNPRTLLDSLYLGSHAAQIIGWPKAKGRELLDALTAHATQDKYIYTHQWEANQLVMWDDRATMHRGSAWDYQRYRRVMARTTVSAPTPTITEQEVEQARAHARSLIDVPLAV